MGKKAGRDLTEGSILKQIILFSLPLIGTYLLSLLFNTADTAVLGLFCGDDVVAGAGCNGALIELITGLALGTSTGSNIIIARYLGAKNGEKARRGIGTSLMFALFAGIIMALIGFFGAETFQKWMGCDPQILPYAVKYMKIYFLGMPIILLYTFIAGILRAMGDSFHPMLYLAIGGVANIALNLFFVLVLKMDVEGVAIATVASQGIALVLSFILLLKNKGEARVEMKYLRFYKEELLEIIRVGIPCGIQSSLFSLTNVILQSFINSFGPAAMTAHAVASKLDAIVYYVGEGIGIAMISFVSQNFGAKKMDRVKKTIFTAFGVCFGMSMIVAVMCYAVKDFYLGFMTESPTVIEYCNVRLHILLTLYFLCGFMDICTCSLRGLGYSFISMIIVLVGCALFRIAWSYIVLTNEATHTLFNLYIVWPISWIITTIVAGITLIFVYRKKKKEVEMQLMDIKVD